MQTHSVLFAIFPSSHGSSVLRYVHWKLDLADTDLAENLDLKDTL